MVIKNISIILLFLCLSNNAFTSGSKEPFTHAASAGTQPKDLGSHTSYTPKKTGGCLRICFSCCCKDTNTVDTAVTVVGVVHSALEALLTFAPFGIRELYLLCKNAAYTLSENATRILGAHGFLDGDGNLKPDWRSITLRLLRYDGLSANAEIFYFQQKIEDLVERYPSITRALIEYERRGDVYIDTMITSHLKSEYDLIALPDKTTLEELRVIVAAIKEYNERFAIKPHGASATGELRATHATELIADDFSREELPSNLKSSRFVLKSQAELRVAHIHDIF